MTVAARIELNDGYDEDESPKSGIDDTIFDDRSIPALLTLLKHAKTFAAKGRRPFFIVRSLSVLYVTDTAPSDCKDIDARYIAQVGQR
jgi:hypothetical protein